MHLAQTPKYGIIFHASLIGQAAPKYKGKIARVLAAKCALSVRVDALGEQIDPVIGIEGRAAVRPPTHSEQPPELPLSCRRLSVGLLQLCFASISCGRVMAW